MSCDWNCPHCNAPDEPEPFYADCPHCERTEFTDEDYYFEHVSMCEWENQNDALTGSEWE